MYRATVRERCSAAWRLSRARSTKNCSVLSEHFVGDGLHRSGAFRAPPTGSAQISTELGLRLIGYPDDMPFAARGLNTRAAVLLSKDARAHDEQSGGDLSRQEEDVFDSLTDKLPEPPVSVAEGASYGVVVLLGLAVAGSAAYAVFKELIFEPKEYKVFGKSLDRVQTDDQVSSRLGSPITGYGQETRNRAARQRISNRAWTDEAGVEHVEVMFYIRGPGGAGKVYSEMFRDPEDKAWKYTYLIVEFGQPYPTRIMLESYVPPLAPSALGSPAVGSKEAALS